MAIGIPGMSQSTCVTRIAVCALYVLEPIYICIDIEPILLYYSMCTRLDQAVSVYELN